MQSDPVSEAMQELDDMQDAGNLLIGVIVGTCLGTVVWLTLILTFGG